MNKTTIMFLGDSITDMGRTKLPYETEPWSFGVGYPQFVAGYLDFNYPGKYKVINKGITGNRVVDLYARIKRDVWNLKPDYLCILIGANDVWHEIDRGDGVDIERFEKVFSMLIEDTQKNVPGIKIMLMEPFVLYGFETENQYDEFLKIKDYAQVVKRISEKYKLPFIPLQEKLDKITKEHGVENYLYDGVHPAPAGAYFIANEFITTFIK